MYNITVRRLVDTLILDSIDFNVIKAILNTPSTPYPYMLDDP